MDKEIEDYCRRCHGCQQAQRAPAKSPWQPWSPASKPWSRLHVDFAGPIYGQTYLIVVDAFTKWPEIFAMKNPSASATVEILKNLFSVFGIPDVIVSDNGSQFMSHIFRSFCSRNNIEQKFSPPYHPQSNGQAERFVDTFKRALLKARGEGPTTEALQTFLTMYRNTPNPQAPDGKAPSEIMFGRKVKTIFDNLRPSLNNERTQERKPQPQVIIRGFKVGDSVLARDYRHGATWSPGVVLRRKGAVIYEIKVGTHVWTRHINQLRRNANGVSKDTSNISFEILLDTFAMKPSNQTAEQEHPGPARRTMTRVRKRPLRLQLEPRMQSYYYSSN